MSARHDLGALRERLRGLSGPKLWRGLDELADTPAFRQFMLTEFPAAARLARLPDRRRFMQAMAASFAMAGLTGCDAEDGRDYEVPYVKDPLHRTAGAPLLFASGALVDGFADGVLVRTRNGRPVKIEGNPDHPWSRGGTNVLAQASVLGMYDPARSQIVRQLNRPSSWQAFRGFATGLFGGLREGGGKGLRLLTGPITSPSLAGQIAAMRQAFPEMVWHSHAPVDREALYDGARQAFGRPVETRHRFGAAHMVVSLGGDALDLGPQQAGVSRDWIDARRDAAAQGRLLTLFSAAATPNLTSAKADAAAVASPDALARLADELLGGMAGDQGDPLAAWRARAAQALGQARGRSIVLVGAAQPAAEHAAAHRLNAALGNIGKTVVYTDPVPVQAAGLADLVRAMQAGEVAALLVLDSNPVYTAPGDLGFGAAMERVPHKVHAGLYADETALHCDWHLPLAHPLEGWGDARAFDGTATLMQPTIAPLYAGRTVPEILSLLVDAEPADGLSLLRTHWAADQEPAAFEKTWNQALTAGFMPATALPIVTVSARPAPAAPAPSGHGGLTVLFRPDPTVWDGSVANNPWLQELPKPLTKIVWDNVVAVSPAMAEREKIAAGDMLKLEGGSRSVDGPAWITPGHADEAVTVFLGYGRTLADLLVFGMGYDAYALRGQASSGQLAGARLSKTGRRIDLACTQDHGTMEGRDFVRSLPVGAPMAGPPERASFYPPAEPGRRAWGMVIDLDACTGCNACVVACQAENNIAVVGKEEVALGREMHWLRIDRYYDGGLDAPQTHFQPVPCMHCEDAPCEVGCPVEATLHDHEGLNLMVYNRCVGTRACSGYCPYKVRRFNWYDYSSGVAASEQLQRNPNVTVRAGGVMEKCTYCVQRIADARITADEGDGRIADGAVVTACQAACPTRAIAFGDLADEQSLVRAARDDPRHYALLEELNLKPCTTYLAERSAPADREG